MTNMKIFVTNESCEKSREKLGAYKNEVFVRSSSSSTLLIPMSHTYHGESSVISR